jgi:hypothetical protein
MAQDTGTDAGLEQRALRAEAALEEALEERNRLWDELHRHKAQEREVEALTEKVARMESSLSWRVPKPIRVAKRVALRLRNADRSKLAAKVKQVSRDD